MLAWEVKITYSIVIHAPITASEAIVQAIEGHPPTDVSALAVTVAPWVDNDQNGDKI
jgi:hypothetical protein